MSEERVRELQRWKDQALHDLQAARAKLTELQKQIRDNEQRVALFESLMALETGRENGSARQATAGADDLLDACEQLMQKAGKPLHIRDLHASLTDQGVPIPGKGAEANLILRLQRSDRFVRTGRGTYAPREFGLSEVRPARTKKVRAKKAQNG
jgi:hypothetical protein